MKWRISRCRSVSSSIVPSLDAVQAVSPCPERACRVNTFAAAERTASPRGACGKVSMPRAHPSRGCSAARRLGLAACSGVKVRDDGEVAKERTRYRVRGAGARVAAGRPRGRGRGLGARLQWSHPGGELDLPDYDEALAQVLRRQHLVGLHRPSGWRSGRRWWTDARRSSPAGEPGSTAWRSSSGLLVLKKDGCIYDFTYTCPRGAYDEQLQAFDHAGRRASPRSE